MTGPTSESIGGASGRQPATDVLRLAAKRLRTRAEGLDAIAAALKRCTPPSTEDGSESPYPHIGVGSSAEIAIWELACSLLR
jgi:hypothetical protein